MHGRELEPLFAPLLLLYRSELVCMVPQAAGVCWVADCVPKLSRVGKGPGAHEFDKEMAVVAASMTGGAPILTCTN